MKTNQVIKIIIPLVLLLGAATAFIVAVIGSQQVNTTAETQESNQATSAYIAFLYIEGVDGEAQAQDHENWIEVLAYSHNVMTADPTGAVRTAGSVQHAPLRITKMVDKASPKLYEKCVNGETIVSVKLDCCTAFGEDLKVFYQIELQNAMITSAQDFGIVAGEGIPTETVSFTYESIRWTYSEFDAAGQKKGDIQTPWISTETSET
ncbi:MAG: type VI secretion system tube protein Hcp [Candidatus Heimdallarchaeota archaeon]|nr:MAG: type VI secretion system tube protein Hcp [Candidatus Heimdallarchaeota archaeon]